MERANEELHGHRGDRGRVAGDGVETENEQVATDDIEGTPQEQPTVEDV